LPRMPQAWYDSYDHMEKFCFWLTQAPQSYTPRTYSPHLDALLSVHNAPHAKAWELWATKVSHQWNYTSWLKRITKIVRTTRARQPRFPFLKVMGHNVYVHVEWKHDPLISPAYSNNRQISQHGHAATKSWHSSWNLVKIQELELCHGWAFFFRQEIKAVVLCTPLLHRSGTDACPRIYTHTKPKPDGRSKCHP